jgi:hypothetical protein
VLGVPPLLVREKKKTAPFSRPTAKKYAGEAEEGGAEVEEGVDESAEGEEEGAKAMAVTASDTVRESAAVHFSEACAVSHIFTVCSSVSDAGIRRQGGGKSRRQTLSLDAVAMKRSSGENDADQIMRSWACAALPKTTHCSCRHSHSRSVRSRDTDSNSGRSDEWENSS